MKVVAFNGSPRHAGNTSILLQAVLAELQAEGIDTELIQIGGRPVRGCTACCACARNQDRACVLTGDPMNEWIAKLAAADGVLLGSPTYFADVTAEMKALMDRAGFVTRANGNLLHRKVGAAVVAVRRGGAIHVFDSLNHFFQIAGMFVVGSSYWNVAFGREKGEVENDDEGMQTMRDLGQNMAYLLKRLHA